MGSLDQERVMLKFAIGQAILTWSNVEHGLFMIAELCLREADSAMTRSGFHAIENFRSKMAFVEAIYGRSKYTPRHDKEFSRLLDLAASLSAIRNKLAHRQLMQYGGNQVKPLPGRIALLEEPGPNIGSHESRSGGIGVRDVFYADMRFTQLFHLLWNLREAMRGEPVEAPLLAFVQLPESPPTIREIRAQMLLELKSLLSPSDLRQLLKEMTR